jgi:hypothetical protein
MPARKRLTCMAWSKASPCYPTFSLSGGLQRCSATTPSIPEAIALQGRAVYLLQVNWHTYTLEAVEACPTAAAGLCCGTA